MENDHSRSFKALSMILVISVIVLFLFIPVATFGQSFESTTDQAIDLVDHTDGRNNFIPGKIKGQSISQKIYTSFSGKNL